MPQQAGQTLQEARAAVRRCAVEGPKGGRAAVNANYIGAVIWGGVVLGPLVIAANEDTIRARGAWSRVDRCLGDQGYQRRELTLQERQALNVRDRYARDLLLEHFINGGTLDTYEGV